MQESHGHRSNRRTADAVARRAQCESNEQMASVIFLALLAVAAVTVATIVIAKITSNANKIPN
jgi:formate/nitrite transporter FocA (FNT family)